MKVFHCHHCSHLAFFENTQCVRCKNALAYHPDFQRVTSVERGEDNLWRSPMPRAKDRTYRLCTNYSKENVCNWAVPAEDANPFCISCRLTRVIPNLEHLENRARWYRLEVAKRRLVYTLQMLGLPLANRTEDPQRGLAFEFLSNNLAPTPVLTGHQNGVITINVAEADDAERETRRVQFHEPYRTLLGHFRHEIGHYYWDRLVQNSDWLGAVREKFGDERQDYGRAMAEYYEKGPPSEWLHWFISAYASSHAWEDWAETWAHFLHMIDTLETAASCGLALHPKHEDEPRLEKVSAPVLGQFDRMIDDWFSVTYALNNLNRGLGLADGYPFVLSTPVIEKLRLIHDVVAKASVISRDNVPMENVRR